MLSTLTQKLFGHSQKNQDVSEAVEARSVNEGLEELCQNVPLPNRKFEAKEHFKAIAQSIDVLQTLPRLNSGKLKTSAELVTLDEAGSEVLSRNLKAFFSHEKWKSAEAAHKVWLSNVIPPELRKIRFSGEEHSGTTPATIARTEINALSRRADKPQTAPKRANVVSITKNVVEPTSTGQEHPASNTDLTAEI